MLYCERCLKLWPDSGYDAKCHCAIASEPKPTPDVHPVQLNRDARRQGKIRAEVVMAAYEVYRHLFGAQAALVTGGCRGGLGAGELIAMLYARRFPKNEWRNRFEEAIHGSVID